MPFSLAKDETTTSAGSYFETYPRKKTGRPSSVTASAASTCSDTFFSPQPSIQNHTGCKRQILSQPGCYRLPSPDMDPPSDPRIPGLRYSGSSSTTHHIDTPPHTPPSVFNISIVSAPIPDVGTMDALVDGMNGFDRDDILYASSLHRHEQFISLKYHPGSSINPPGNTTYNDAALGRCTSFNATRSRIPRPKPKKDSQPSNSQVFPSVQEKERCRFSINPSKPDFQSLGEHPKAPIKALIPSIHDIVRAHAPDLTPTKAVDSRDSIDLISRSSIDTIAEEVQHTLRQPLPESIPSTCPSSDNPSDFLTVSDRRRSYLSNSNESKESNISVIPQSEAIATYIRSTRLTTLVKIPRPLRAPLQVSLSDLGDQNGRPLVVFLGLGAVRYIMGLYDEMAELLGLRIITIDRWGLGRTSQDSPNNRGVKEWARVISDVLDRLGIQHCSVLAHSAGAPYAMSFANLYPARITGDICLLAPWVGGSESSGYKWLKYVPNSLLKTAQAVEWRLQTWMLGKPPSMHYQGIGYTKWEPAIDSHESLADATELAKGPLLDRQRQLQKKKNKSSSARSDQSSILSNDYDDLADFEGCFETHGTLTTIPSSPINPTEWLDEGESRKRRTSRGLFRALVPRASGARRDSAASRPSATDLSLSESGPNAPKLKSLRSIGSLRSSTKSIASSHAQFSIDIPSLPQIGLGFGDLQWPKSMSVATTASSTPPPVCNSTGQSSHSRSRRSISLTARASNYVASSHQRQIHSQTDVNSARKLDVRGDTLDYQASLANALVAASHSEASKGIHSDLLQILNHDGKSWGFNYISYPHKLKVWYGDKDERIAEGAVRWMERSMGVDRCEVKVVKDADHNLMYRTAVIVEVLEVVRGYWQ